MHADLAWHERHQRRLHVLLAHQARELREVRQRGGKCFIAGLLWAAVQQPQVAQVCERSQAGWHLAMCDVQQSQAAGQA